MSILSKGIEKLFPDLFFGNVGEELLIFFRIDKKDDSSKLAQNEKTFNDMLYETHFSVIYINYHNNKSYEQLPEQKYIFNE